MNRNLTVSMQDVAREAGVSPQTVSRVTNGSKSVRDETRVRVEEAMDKLGYRPNYAARALKYGRFNDIGVVVFSLYDYGDSRILDGIVAAAVDEGYAVTVRTMGVGKERSLQAAVERMAQLPVDGIIVVLQQDVPDFDTFVPPKEMPVVLVCEGASTNCPTVDADQYGCSTSIVDYLLEQGHSTVHHIAGPMQSRAACSRLQGWNDQLDRHGIAAPQALIGDWGADSGYRAGFKLAHDPECTAVYAANDQMAYGAILGLKDGGRRVPEDVSIVGVDDSLRGIVPKLDLTTIRMRFDTIGHEAFTMIRKQCEGENVPVNVKTVIPGELIERGSVARYPR